MGTECRCLLAVVLLGLLGVRASGDPAAAKVAFGLDTVVPSPNPAWAQAVMVKGAVESEGLNPKTLPALFDGNPTTFVHTTRASSASITVRSARMLTAEGLQLDGVRAGSRYEFYLAGDDADLQSRVKAKQPSAAGTLPETGDLGKSTVVWLSRPLVGRIARLVLYRPKSAAEGWLGEFQLVGRAYPTMLRVTVDRKNAPRLYPTWSLSLKTFAHLDDGGVYPIDPKQARVTCLTPETAVIEKGKLLLLKPGVARLRAEYGDFASEEELHIQRPAFPEWKPPISSALASPAPGHLWEVPFVWIIYLPTTDGINLNPAFTGLTATVNQAYEIALARVLEGKWQLEEASRYHGYKNPASKPSLGYRLVGIHVFYEDTPRGVGYPDGHGGLTYAPDYHQMLRRIDGRRYVEDLGVKEFWLSHYHHGDMAPDESNMASPLTGDVSNSACLEDDMPKYKRTYLMMAGPGMARGVGLHCYGHQIERALWHIESSLPNQDKLASEKWMGLFPDGFRKGRAGTCHHPPNANDHYDYNNKVPVLSDCEDWRPDGSGRKKLVSCLTWQQIPYRPPSGLKPGVEGSHMEDDAYYYIYWLQNMPGRGAGIPYRNGMITNWWRFLGDWDGAIKERYGLWAPFK
jgi:hypothetical protein